MGKEARSGGSSGPGPCSAASSGLWSLILGASVRKEAGAGSPQPLPVPAQSPSPQPLGILLPGVSVSPERVPGILSISPSSLGGPGRSPAWAPPSQAVLVSRKGRVKALSRKNEAEQSEEQGQQPEQGGQRGQAQSLLPAGRPVPQETQPGPHKPARPVSGHLTAAGRLRVPGGGAPLSKILPSGCLTVDPAHSVIPFPPSLTPAQGGPPSGHR